MFDFDFFKKLELTAQKKLAEFVNTKVTAFSDLSNADKESVVVDANGDTTEDSLETATEILSGINVSAEALLVGSVELGSHASPRLNASDEDLSPFISVQFN